MLAESLMPISFNIGRQYFFEIIHATHIFSDIKTENILNERRVFTIPE